MQVCLLADNTGIREYFISALQEMVSETNAELSLIIINQNPPIAPQTIRDAAEDGVMSIVSYLRQQFIETPSYLERRELDAISLLKEVESRRAKPIPVEGELGHTLPEDIVSEIESKADIVVRHGFGILRGRILTGPKHGVLSFHHGDIREYRGAAQGFWNFIYDEPTAGVTLQRLTPQLDAGEIVAFREVNIESCHTWQDVRAHLFEASVPMIAEGIENVIDPNVKLDQPESLGELYTASDMYRPAILTRYLLKNSSGRIKRALK